jgi:hypothetical protein
MNKLPARADFDLHPTEHLARERVRKILRGLFLSMVPGIFDFLRVPRKIGVSSIRSKQGVFLKKK